MSAQAKVIEIKRSGLAFSVNPVSYLNGSFGAYKAACDACGAKFDRQNRCQSIGAEGLARLVAKLQSEGFSVAMDEAAKAAAVESVARAEEKAAEVAANDGQAEISRMEPALAKKGFSLFAFQRDGIAWLANRESALLADEMGLGKTLQTVAMLPSEGAVVVCPSVAKGVWAREIKTYRPDLTVVVLSGRNSFRWPGAGEVVITNYDILPKAPKDIYKDAPTVDAPPAGVMLVADEAHALKNNKAQRTNAFRMLQLLVRRAKGKTVLLTATPMLNRPPELWSVLTSAGLQREAFGSYNRFKSLFGGRDEQVSKWVTATVWDGPTKETSEIIGNDLSRVMLRRLRANVLDLPAKTWQSVPVELSAATARVCDKFLRELEADGQSVEDILEGRVSISFEKLSMIRATLASAKIEAMFAEVESYEESDEPVVVFSAHRAPIDLFANRDGWRVITGDTSADERSEIQEMFQAGKLRGVACTIKAGGVAITLTRAAHALFVDLEWTPALNAQAEDRIMRIGQSRTVLIKRLVAAHPLDERITQLLSKKQTMINASVEQTEGTAVMPSVEVPSVDFDALLSEAQAESIRQAANVERENVRKTAKHNSKASRYRGDGAHRPAVSAREAACVVALRQLSDCCDGVQSEDGMGFSMSTVTAGNWLLAELAMHGGLTDGAWKLAEKIVTYHKSQVGDLPNV